MRMRTLGIAAALSAALIQDTGAVVPSKAADAPMVSAGRGPRSHRATEWSAVDQLPGWRAIWDRDTGVPLRIWGSGVIAQGAVAEKADRRSGGTRHRWPESRQDGKL
jgi:hypothetical protein